MTDTTTSPAPSAFAPWLPGARPPGAVLVPRSMLGYRCRRTMVCCHDPFSATVNEAEQARLGAALAESEAGRAILATLAETIEPTEEGGDVRRWKKDAGRCVHLVVGRSEEERGCGLQRAAGLEVLPVSCRNFPRFVEDVGRDWEVSFALSCPTAAALLTSDAEPISVVALPDDAPWPYAPRARITVPDARRALRDAWWAVLGEAREGGAAATIAALGAMLTAPLEPPSERWPAMPDGLGAPVHPMAAMVIVQAILALPERGVHYAEVANDLVNQLVAPWPSRRFVDAAEPAPDILAAFVEHQLHQLVVHPMVPADNAVSLFARQGLTVLRVVDALCDLVPFRSKALFTDAIAACARVDPATVGGVKLGFKPPDGQAAAG